MVTRAPAGVRRPSAAVRIAGAGLAAAALVATGAAAATAVGASDAPGAGTPFRNPFVLTAPQGPAPRTSAPVAPQGTPGVTLDRHVVGLGEAVTITVIRPLAPGVAAPPLALSALEPGFELREVNRGEEPAAPAARRERWRIVAYPRQAGRLTLPRWGLPGPAAVLDVTDGGPGAPRVRLRLDVDGDVLYERAGTRLTLQACTDGAVQWERPRLASDAGLLLRPLGESELTTTVDGQRCTATRWHWALWPTAPGPLLLRPPVLQGMRFGQALRFPVPARLLEVLPVPRWLPQEVAVGPVQVALVDPPAEPAAAPAHGPVVGEPWPLSLDLRADLPADVLRRLLQAQLAAHPAWARYAPELQPRPDGDAVPRWRVTLHALPERGGTLALPALSWTWYAPDARGLRSTAGPVWAATVHDPVARRWQAGLRALLACALLAAGAAVAWRSLGWRWRRWRFGRRLGSVATAADLQALVLAFGLGPRRQVAPTFAAWRQAFDADADATDPAPWLAPLQRLLYAGRAQDDAEGRRALHTLLPALRQWLAGVRPRRPRPVQSTSSGAGPGAWLGARLASLLASTSRSSRRMN